MYKNQYAGDSWLGITMEKNIYVPSNKDFKKYTVLSP